MKATHAAIAGFLITVASAALVAQAPVSTARPAFEVATIKRSTSIDTGGSAAFQPGGRFRVVNLDARSLIASAYRTTTGQRLFNPQIVGAPDWLRAERYDMTAGVSGELAALAPAELFQKLPLILQSLFEDRFKLTFHWETRELPVYALTLARRDGALGPQLKRSSIDCGADRSKCRLQFLPGHITALAIPMDTLAAFLTGSLARVVIDRTTLTGVFDAELEWSPDQSSADKPSIFTAAQEQLGLKIESTRAPVEVMVIDHVERPTED